jgi:hypothetical protein
MKFCIVIKCVAWHQWLTSVILAAWEAKIRKIAVQGQRREKFM